MEIIVWWLVAITVVDGVSVREYMKAYPDQVACQQALGETVPKRPTAKLECEELKAYKIQPIIVKPGVDV